MKILVKFPSRERPQQFLKVLKLLNDRASDKNNIDYLVTVDDDDFTMTPDIQNEAHAICEPWFNVGKSDSKIHACNRGMDTWEKDWDILILMSDDMIPMANGWDEAIRGDMEIYFPDTDGCLWYGDGYQDRICTMSIIGKKYYDRFGYIYHPDYHSLWCDEEFTNVAQGLGKLAHNVETIFKHEHFINNPQIKKDKLYERNEALYSLDKNTYDRRKAEGFRD